VITRRGLVLAAAASGGLQQPQGELQQRVMRVLGEGLPADLRSLIHYDEFIDDREFPQRYFEADRSNGAFTVDTRFSHTGTSGSMRATFAKGAVSAGSLKVAFGDNPVRPSAAPRRFTEIYWRVYVLHQPGWHGNPAKLSRAMCMAGRDWSQGMIAHVWGGKGDTLCIDPATGITDSRLNTRRYNDFERLRWLGMKQGSTPIFSEAESGRWVCVEAQAKLNSPGKADGLFRLWVDAQLEAEATMLNWHGEWQERGINAVFLENYWNGGSPLQQSRWFDDFVISPTPIGPVRTGGNPAFELCSPKGSAWQARIFPIGSKDDWRWESYPQPVGKGGLRADAQSGTFQPQAQRLSPGTYRISLRVRDFDGRWHPYGPMHAAFQVDPLL
jgi:hypothetical protein